MLFKIFKAQEHELMLKMFSLCVRSKVECCSTVWSHGRKKQNHQHNSNKCSLNRATTPTKKRRRTCLTSSPGSLAFFRDASFLLENKVQERRHPSSMPHLFGVIMSSGGITGLRSALNMELIIYMPGFHGFLLGIW